MPRMKRPCPGGGHYPKKITHKPGGAFSGYGICSTCDHECALLPTGKMMAHRDRRPEEQEDPDEMIPRKGYDYPTTQEVMRGGQIKGKGFESPIV